MTDVGLVLKKIAQIETGVRELRTLARPSALATDVRERRFVEHTLQITIQAAMDAASHVVSDERLGEPRTNRELFTLLAGAGWIAGPLADALGRAAGLRNLLVHGYAEVDTAMLETVLADHLDELLSFAATLRARLAAV